MLHRNNWQTTQKLTIHMYRVHCECAFAFWCNAMQTNKKKWMMYKYFFNACCVYTIYECCNACTARVFPYLEKKKFICKNRIYIMLHCSWWSHWNRHHLCLVSTMMHYKRSQSTHTTTVTAVYRQCMQTVSYIYDISWFLWHWRRLP